VKQAGYLAGDGINAGEIGSLVEVTVDAGEGEFGKSFRCSRIKCGSIRVLGRHNE